ncbi:helix-turn-helix domain-containing protein [Legionella septentrionalis]|uniref:AraC family transcriptional regulator n=1 Tax=Legionella septentrionalis TaxID=2498109 RepID=A0A3S0XRW2_9GAMM|nr:AraC family transcriptional regulator [Legionella septentrionalis]RUQ81016.1 AraC family transcriptional regulator [Legionella septentrionalis]RUQ99348.1 AraC family transcriptional regulator [Legionella septentrionalis]RUR08763.1 AraC family transcriptional regulator [Legionella septentrionalis]
MSNLRIDRTPRQLSLCTYGTEIQQHTHGFAQFVLPVQGSLELEMGGAAGKVTTETAALILPDTVHSFAGSPNNSFIVFNVPEQDICLSQVPTSGFINLNEVTKKFLHFTQTYLALNNPSHAILDTDILLQNLLLNLLHRFPRNEDKLVGQIKKWIDKNYAAKIQLKELAKIFHLSQSQLQRRFKYFTGLGLAEYWRNRRIEHAKLLLEFSNSNVKTIAYTVGYENISAFTRRFTALYGIPPCTWRKIKRNHF